MTLGAIVVQARRQMASRLKEFFGYIKLPYFIIMHEILIRHKQSALGAVLYYSEASK